MTIIIKVPQPDTEWRLVLVTRNTVIHATYGRDATPEDLARAGFRECLVAAEAEQSARRADDWQRKAESLLARAEGAERERDDLLARINDAEQEARTLRAERAKRERAEHERDEQVARAGDAEASRAHAQAARWTAEAERDTLRTELARLTAPAEGEPTPGQLLDACPPSGGRLLACYRLGVAHERARQPAQDRATDEELERAYSVAYARAWESELSTPDRGERAGVLAVAAHVRGERCLVTRAVGMEADVSLDRHPRGLGERAYTLRVQCPTRPSAIAADVPASDVPATLARLLGEVTRG